MYCDGNCQYLDTNKGKCKKEARLQKIFLTTNKRIQSLKQRMKLLRSGI